MPCILLILLIFVEESAEIVKFCISMIYIFIQMIIMPEEKEIDQIFFFNVCMWKNVACICEKYCMDLRKMVKNGR